MTLDAQALPQLAASAARISTKIIVVEGMNMSLAHRALGLAATVATAVAANLALSDVAFAYIDPGTGTMLLQLAGALIAAGLFYLRSARLWVSRRLGFGKTNAEPRIGDDGDRPKAE